MLIFLKTQQVLATKVASRWPVRHDILSSPAECFLFIGVLPFDIHCLKASYVKKSLSDTGHYVARLDNWQACSFQAPDWSTSRIILGALVRDSSEEEL